jgi:uncharacterized membrane protein YphA (DoxX/SURF4 family)
MEQKTNKGQDLFPYSVLRTSIGLIYFWFGALKFFHGYSPAEQLAINTITKLTFHLIPDHTGLVLLAIWEVGLGILLISGRNTRTALMLMFIHLACTFTPLFLFPDESFKYLPYGFTLVGQYIMKNIIIVSAGWVLWKKEQKKPGAEHFSIY